MRRLLILSMTATALTLSGCGPSKAEREAELKAIMEQIAKESAEKKAKANEQIKALNDQELISLISSCKAAIMQEARQRYKPFEPFMVDEHSADIYQAATHLSGGKINKPGDISARVKQYRERVKSGQDKNLSDPLDTRFSVMVTQDSFSGPQKQSIEASCEFELGSPPQPIARLSR